MSELTRREYLKILGAGSALLASRRISLGQNAPSPATESPDVIADRQRRMAWWKEAKFGMFIHWGLYSILGRHEWVMEMEGIPATEYQEIAKRFKPKPNAARDWARLAK